MDVLKAKSRLTAGTKPDMSHFSIVSVYGDNLREMRAMLVDAKDLNTYSQIPLAETVEQGQVLLQSSFRFNGNRGIRNAIGPDQRAIALSVKDETSAVAYFVRPGDTVDVWVLTGEKNASMENLIPGAVVQAVDDATVITSENAGRDFRYRSVTVVVPAAGLGDILFKLKSAKNEVTLALVGTASVR